MLLLRVNALIKGYSGIRLEVIEKMVEFLNKNLLPVVYSQGSLGASGDLAPLSHMALPLIGLGEVTYNGIMMSSKERLEISDTLPIKNLKAKIEDKEILRGINLTVTGGNAPYNYSWSNQATIEDLLDVTEQSLYEGLKQARAGNRLSDISHAIQVYAESHGYSIVREFVGHGLGKNLHEDPQIPNYGLPHKGILLKAGMTVAIEPMVNMGRKEVKVLSDNWTAVTVDKSLSAHFEHSILITEGDCVIFTTLKEES